MNRLILLRHGDADRDSATGGDFDRALSAGGLAEVSAMGLTLVAMGLVPDLALVSSAARTRQTWAELATVFPGTRVEFDNGLYLAEAESIAQILNGDPGDCDTLMVIGHNPGLQELALSLLLTANAPASAISRVQTGFPTAAAAVFLFDVEGRPTSDGLFYPRDER